MAELGKLVKVEIHLFDDEKLTEKSDLEVNPLRLPVNPESFSQNYKIEINTQQGSGTQGSNPKYSKTHPEELKLDFIFDGTNTIEGYHYNISEKEAKDKIKTKSTREQVQLFLDSIYMMKGDIHKPPFLKIQWGQLLFPCILKSLDLNYTLFHPNGDPIRVKASATFVGHLAPEERVAIERTESPDLTHVKTAKGGDRLDLMTYRIYNNPQFVTQIARVNGLSSFRKVRPGTELIFPPLQKKTL